MLTFIVPLKSQAVSSDWAKVSSNLARTLKSITNQTCNEYKVLVVCHEKPEISYSHPSVSYIQVEFPPPQKWIYTGMEADYRQLRVDKCRKVWLGIDRASLLKTSHIMIVDADDCISKEISGFVNENQNHPGWFLKTGYEYQENKNRLFYKSKGFYKRCGTSDIIRFDLVYPQENEEKVTSGSYLGHAVMRDIIAAKNEKLAALPFPGAIYITDNEENIRSQERFYKVRSRGKYLSQARMKLRVLYINFVSASPSKEIGEEFSLWTCNP